MPRWHLDSDLSLDFLRVVEQAAIACAHTMGQGDRHKSDQVAVEAMRQEMDSVPIDGTIVIGEGERDEAPMLYIGEKVGHGRTRRERPAVSRRSTSPSIRSKARTSARPARPTRSPCSRRRRSGGLLHAPDIYMEKLVVGPSSRDVVDLDAPVRFNLRAIAQALGRRVEDLVVIVLDRPRHEKLIAEIRATGARIRLIGDGDLSAGIAAAVVGSGVHAVMGIGGAPEGVLTAAAMRCLERRDLRAAGRRHSRSTRSAAARWASRTSRGSIARRTWRPGKNIIFAATGVTDGTLMKGVRFFGDGIRTTSLVMQTHPHRIRFIDSIHVRAEGSTRRSGSSAVSFSGAAPAAQLIVAIVPSLLLDPCLMLPLAPRTFLLVLVHSAGLPG